MVHVLEVVSPCSFSNAIAGQEALFLTIPPDVLGLHIHMIIEPGIAPSNTTPTPKQGIKRLFGPCFWYGSAWLRVVLDYDI